MCTSYLEMQNKLHQIKPVEIYIFDTISTAILNRK